MSNQLKVAGPIIRLPMAPNASAASELDAEVQQKLVSALIETSDPVGITENYTEFCDWAIPHIIRNLFKVDSLVEVQQGDAPKKTTRVQFHFTHAEVGRPMGVQGGSGPIFGPAGNMYPRDARERGTYSAPIHIAGEATIGEGPTARRFRVPDKGTMRVDSLPIMLHSNRCNLAALTPAQRKAVGEDPRELGGYFIIKTNEIVLNFTENLRYNHIHAYGPAKHDEIFTVAHADMISQLKAWDNSTQIQVRLWGCGAITVYMNSPKMRSLEMPVALVFRLLGLNSDRELLDRVLFTAQGRPRQQMEHILLRALRSRKKPHTKAIDWARALDILDPAELLAAVVPEVERHLQSAHRADAAAGAELFDAQKFLRNLDTEFFPHMGQHANDREAKLHFFGYFIHRMLLVHLGVEPPSDRNNYANKRVHDAAASMTKAFKTKWNTTVMRVIRASLADMAKAGPKASVLNATNSMVRAVRDSGLGQHLERAIIAANRDSAGGKGETKQVRMQNQTLERKNNIETVSNLRTIHTSGGGSGNTRTEQANFRRRVHSSHVPWLCPVRSADTGEQVGQSRELTAASFVSRAGSAERLHDAVRADPAFVPLEAGWVDTAAAGAGGEGLLLNGRKGQPFAAGVFLNGRWIGCCRDPVAFAARYVALRRDPESDVDPLTTVAWHSGATFSRVELSLDLGRVMRPFLTVRNNIEEYDAGYVKRGAKKVQFEQGLIITDELIGQARRGELSARELVDGLLKIGALEYVAIDEAVNILVAESPDALERDRHDVLKQYTHCELPPAILSLTALVSPYANHTQAARVCYETNQVRQAGSWYTLGTGRYGRNKFFMWRIQRPVVDTITRDLHLPCGNNLIVAYASYLGDHQEDGCILNEASVDRGMFAGSFYRYTQVEFEPADTLATPNPAQVGGMVNNRDYSKLVDGKVAVGTVVEQNDVLVGRIRRLTSAEAARLDSEVAYQFQDASVPYTGREPARVVDVRDFYDDNNARIVRVKLEYTRHIIVGDKMSSRAGNKAIGVRMLPASEMPYDDNGVRPDMIFNPHALPSRMTVGQVKETVMSMVAADRGAHVDATAFAPVDDEQVVADLMAAGRRANGRRRLYNPQTGEAFVASVFMGPTHIQRLMKFVSDDAYAVGHSAPYDHLTHQPRDGKARSGGLRNGEMEKDVLMAHGAISLLREKFHDDSDGRQVPICRGCDRIAIYNARETAYGCPRCGELADIAVCDTSKASIVAMQEMMACGVDLRMEVEPRRYTRTYDAE